MTEENKAIEDLKEEIEYYKVKYFNSKDDEEYNDKTLYSIRTSVKDSEVLLNLIEKLQKENEELRKNQKYKKDFNGEKIFCLEYDKETLRDIVLEQQEEIKELNNRDTSRLSEIGELRTKNSHLENEIKYYYIPKDKISELIKEPTIITSDGDYISVKKVKKLLEEE